MLSAGTPLRGSTAAEQGLKRPTHSRGANPAGFRRRQKRRETAGRLGNQFTSDTETPYLCTRRPSDRFRLGGRSRKRRLSTGMLLAIWTSKEISWLTTGGSYYNDVRVTERCSRDCTGRPHCRSSDARRGINSCTNRSFSFNTISTRRILGIGRDRYDRRK